MHTARTVRLGEQLKTIADQALFVGLPFFAVFMAASIIGM
jgi:hypothetical protein